jgi:hypothetical protein
MGDKSTSVPGFDLAFAKPKKSGDILGPIPLFHYANAIGMDLFISHGGDGSVGVPFHER